VSDDQRLVLLTGVGRSGQTGEVIAQAFASRGARLILVDREEQEAEARAAELRAAGADARAFSCDLSDESHVAALAASVRAAYGDRLDALINAAGGFAMSNPVAESEPAVWERLVAINLTTAYLTTRAFLPLVRSARGSIVYFASVAALPGSSGARMAAYAAAKSGVLALMRAVAEEERANGVRANAVAPTSIRTAANIRAMGEQQGYVEREDVAAAVVWLCSDEARAITGQILRLG
jgi:NAD(P)-dependent dehydrogenase (short-subunit alcohol dehydrogenase family)